MLNEKVTKLLEQLSQEMAAAGYRYAIVTVGAGGQLAYSGNVSSAEGARLMQSWLEAETDSSCADARPYDIFELLAN